MALITLKDVTIAFEGVSAVEGASFSVERGDYLVMIGENGSGKSTLIRAMLGLVHPERGSVTYGDGLRKNQIGYLPQQTAAQRDFPASVEEVVLSGCANRIGKFHFFYQKRHGRNPIARFRADSSSARCWRARCAQRIRSCCWMSR